jgi:hypothetical protein
LDVKQFSLPSLNTLANRGLANISEILYGKQIKTRKSLVMCTLDITKNVFSLNNWNFVFGNEFWFYKLTIFREYRVLIIKKAPQTVVTGTFLLYQEL